jgi:hypothetical protein
MREIEFRQSPSFMPGSGAICVRRCRPAEKSCSLGRMDSGSGRIRDFGHHEELPSGLPVAKPAPQKTRFKPICN